MIFLIIIVGINTKLFSQQEVIELNGKKYVDAESFNNCVRDYQTMHGLLTESNDTLKEIKRENSRIIKENEKLKKQIEDSDDVSMLGKVKIFFSGMGAGGVAVLIIFLI